MVEVGSAGPRLPTSSPQLFDALVSDLLVKIFQHIPMRPLLLVVQLVCKRWKRVALLSVQTLSWLWRFVTPEALLSFENLTEATHSHRKQPLPADCIAMLSQRVSSLTISQLDSGSITCGSHLMVLTMRTVSAEQLAAVAPSLTRLCVERLSAPELPSVYLPNLRKMVFITQPPLAFMLLHIRQLTSLSWMILTASDLAPMYRTCKDLPLLRQVAIAIDGTDVQIEWLVGLTALTSLEVRCSAPPADNLTRLLTSQAHVVSCLRWASQSILDFVSHLALPWLRTLLTDVSSIPGSLLTGLTSLSIADPLLANVDAFASLQRYCTTLVKLTITAEDLQSSGKKFDAIIRWHLPCLRSLMLYGRYEPQHGLDGIRQITRAWPTLRGLRTNIWQPSSSVPNLAEIGEVLRELVEHGVEELSVQHTVPNAVKQLMQEFKWITVTYH